MASAVRDSAVVRFGTYEVDLATAELRKAGVRVPLQDQSFRLLVCLTQNDGRLVTRDELRQALWSGDTFVDFDRGLNTAIKRLRDALGDTAETPRFIETLPKRGYRFVAPIQHGPPVVPPAANGTGGRLTLASIVSMSLVAVVLVIYFVARPAPIRSLAVLPLDNLSNDPGQDYLAAYVHDALIVTFAEISQIRVTSRTSVLRYEKHRPPVSELARALSVDSVVEGGVERVGDTVRVTARLIDPASDRVLVNAGAERPIAEIRSLSSDVAQRILTELRVPLTRAEARRMRPAQPVVPAAYEAVAKGRVMTQRKQRLASFQEATAIDPEYADAYVALGAEWQYAALTGQERPAEAAKRAKDAALKGDYARRHASSRAHAVGHDSLSLRPRLALCGARVAPRTGLESA